MNEMIYLIDGFGNDDKNNVIYYTDTDSMIVEEW